MNHCAKCNLERNEKKNVFLVYVEGYFFCSSCYKELMGKMKDWVSENKTSTFRSDFEKAEKEFEDSKWKKLKYIEFTSSQKKAFEELEFQLMEMDSYRLHYKESDGLEGIHSACGHKGVPGQAGFGEPQMDFRHKIETLYKNKKRK